MWSSSHESFLDWLRRNEADCRAWIKCQEDAEKAWRRKNEADRRRYQEADRKAERERAERARSARVRTARARAEYTQRERSERAWAERVNAERAERAWEEHERAERKSAECERAERVRAERARREETERVKSEHAREEREKAERAASAENIAPNLPHYILLGLERHCTEEEITRAYRRLALKHHPDKNGGSKKAEETFKGIVNAYEILSDPKSRRTYDAFF